jgi:hypothetical protein
MRYVILVSLLAGAGCAATSVKPQPVQHVAPYASGPAAMPEDRAGLYPQESRVELRGPESGHPGTK